MRPLLVTNVAATEFRVHLTLLWKLQWFRDLADNWPGLSRCVTGMSAPGHTLLIHHLVPSPHTVLRQIVWDALVT
jgi:hypothetical protein